MDILANPGLGFSVAFQPVPLLFCLFGVSVGMLIGVLPGAGATVAIFVAYGVETRVAKDRSRFGKGAIEGIAAPEAANNAAAQTTFIPTLSLGIPGDAVTALILGAMMIHGVQPGPGFIENNPAVFRGLLASFWIGYLMLLVINLRMIGLWVRLLAIPYKYLYPMVILLICVGVYSINNNPFDLLVVVAFSAIGYGMMLAGLPAAPLILGFVLGPMAEENFCRAALLARGDLKVFLTTPISALLLAIAAAVLLVPLALHHWRRGRKVIPDAGK